MIEPVVETSNIPEWDMGDRLRKSLKTAGVSVNAMAEYVGVTRETVSTWVNSRHEPPRSAVKLWALRTGVPYEWITTGCTPRDLNPEPTDSGSVIRGPWLNDLVGDAA